MGTWMYFNVFQYYQAGYGTAIAVVITVVAIVVSIPYVRPRPRSTRMSSSAESPRPRPCPTRVVAGDRPLPEARREAKGGIAADHRAGPGGALLDLPAGPCW